MSDNNSSSSGGISIGAILAGILSWTTWHNVGWCILHIIFGWFYVIYWLIEYWKTPFDKLTGM